MGILKQSNTAMQNPKTAPRHLVLWDGECGFCRRSVIWMARHDRRGLFEFLPFQEAQISPQLRAACARAIHVLTTDGQTLRAGRAALYILRATKWRRLARLLEWPIFLPFVEFGYALIAANRGFVSRFLFRAG